MALVPHLDATHLTNGMQVMLRGETNSGREDHLKYLRSGWISMFFASFGFTSTDPILIQK